MAKEKKKEKRKKETSAVKQNTSGHYVGGGIIKSKRNLLFYTQNGVTRKRITFVFNELRYTAYVNGEPRV